MYVHMDCSGRENKIRKSLKNVKGIHQIVIDRNQHKVTVMGIADQRKIIKAVKRTGKLVEPWPYQTTDQEYIFNHYYINNCMNPSLYSTTCSNYFSSVPHNYYGSSHHGYFPRNKYSRRGHIRYFNQPAYSDMVKDRPDVYFSDDNALGCSIM
ncbi:hypothetical protein SAY87_022285 [Trapa incisa]|uniref:HMA domain-containing protein n=1 Tax=Trapa incisa TaxID=236973 RepID=A0AAN7Q547_9MYRT|nr:hypothetical protein SAY87_022285 [Trapa incisa]